MNAITKLRGLLACSRADIAALIDVHRTTVLRMEADPTKIDGPAGLLLGMLIGRAEAGASLADLRLFTSAHGAGVSPSGAAGAPPVCCGGPVPMARSSEAMGAGDDLARGVT